MHNAGPFLIRPNKLFDTNIDINPNLGVLETTYKLASQKCQEFLTEGENLHSCNRLLTAGTLCIVEHKASNLYGDIRDNVFICKNDLKLLKNSLSHDYKNFPFEKMDSFLKSVSQSTSHIYKI